MVKEIIQAKELTKIYDCGDETIFALNKVSFKILEGELVAIIGKSGSGKSTLMNLLGCLDTATKGEYLLHGKEIKGLSANQLAQVRGREIGFIFQGFYLLPSLTAVENVALPLKYMGVHKSKRREMAEKALESVGLAQRMDHLPGQLSGGQQQRVAIARAIVGNPPIILADEPTGNLDTASGDLIIKILLNLWKEGHTVILITHDPQIAQLAPRVLTVEDGRLFEEIQ